MFNRFICWLFPQVEDDPPGALGTILVWQKYQNRWQEQKPNREHAPLVCKHVGEPRLVGKKGK